MLARIRVEPTGGSICVGDDTLTESIVEVYFLIFNFRKLLDNNGSS
jgi:hypothetical protein